MSNNKYRSELLKFMKKNKMFTLPITCRCGYKAKNGNWTDMEKHYEICEQYRNFIKQLKSTIQSSAFELSDNIKKLVDEIRKIESENKGEGYKYLEEIKNEIPKKMNEQLYKTIKSCLDNPDKKFNCNVNYIVD